MTDAPKPTLTEAERQAIRSVPTEMALHSAAEFHAEIDSIVRAIVKAREAAARREALLEAAEHFTARANRAHQDDLHMVSDTWDMAAADLRDLAEPERDEEGR